MRFTAPSRLLLLSSLSLTAVHCQVTDDSASDGNNPRSGNNTRVVFNIIIVVFVVFVFAVIVVVLVQHWLPDIQTIPNQHRQHPKAIAVTTDADGDTNSDANADTAGFAFLRDQHECRPLDLEPHLRSDVRRYDAASLYDDSLYVDWIYVDSIWVGSIDVDWIYVDWIYVDSIYVDSIYVDSICVDSICVDSICVDSICVDHHHGHGW
ncbi:hypothetical protein UCDDS831_g09058 [Diplodia seriata]|uniref:Uncharacterized protein n=1 Tax=Diplodia seriata TaxID=420778 RepID=A0A0G2DRR4_9PEZI|nr:hypothetical protein UCDDS831_g09058 [Diplodia seriata]